MGDFQASIVLPQPREIAFNYLRDPRNFLKLFPASATKNLDVRLPDVLDSGVCLEFNFKAMGNHFQIVQKITDLLDGERIVATQLKGPFRLWIHEQRFADAAGGETLLTNSIKFEPPGGFLGMLVTRKQILSHLHEWVGQGHELLRQQMAQHTP